MDVWGTRKDLRRLRDPEELEALGVFTRRLESLAGVERMRNLRRVVIERMRSPELWRLEGLPLEQLIVSASGCPKSSRRVRRLKSTAARDAAFSSESTVAPKCLRRKSAATGAKST